jgi:ABC-type uncharacterized transport system ATPase subunit
MGLMKEEFNKRNHVNGLLLKNAVNDCGEKNTIRDISIHEPPIETVIKKLYE